MQMRAADAILSAIGRKRWRGFRSILCAVDFSPQSRAALRYADAIAQRSKAALTVVYVSDPLLVAAAAAALHDRGMARRTRDDLQKWVAAAVAPASAARISLKTAVATPVAGILAAARRARADLIVMGTHGETGAARLLLGSTTLAVLQRTTTPVLAVPPRRRPR